MGKVMFMRKGEVHSYTAPVKGLALSSLAEGSIVYLNENGSPVEFYVAKHDYESALNGAGRTLLVRKDLYGLMAWNTAGGNAYASCSMDEWFNGDYKALLDAAVQSAISETMFYYTPSSTDTTVTTLSRSVFALSLAEYGFTTDEGTRNTEGSALSMGSSLCNAYLDGTQTPHWSRTPGFGGTSFVGKVWRVASSTGAAIWNPSAATTNAARPCFTLPNTAVFDETTFLFKGVA